MSLDVQQELTALWACMTVTGQLGGNRAKGEYLLAEFTKNQVLRQWFTLALRGDYNYGITTSELRRTTVMGQGDDQHLHPRQLLKQIATEAITQTKFNYQWVRWLLELPTNLHVPLGRVLDRDLQCGVDTALLNKVLVRLEKEPVPALSHEAPLRTRQLQDYVLIIGTDGQHGVHNGTFVGPDNRKAGHLQIDTNTAGKELIQALRKAGVAVTVPSYAKGL